MAEWDRKALLQLVDEACTCMGSNQLSATQRHALQSLVSHFGAKAKSITASPDDVQRLQGQMARILDTPGEDA